MLWFNGKKTIAEKTEKKVEMNQTVKDRKITDLMEEILGIQRYLVNGTGITSKAATLDIIWNSGRDREAVHLTQDEYEQLAIFLKNIKDEGKKKAQEKLIKRKKELADLLCDCGEVK
jgi:hypothetical protein